jgi:hypothetical protein
MPATIEFAGHNRGIRFLIMANIMANKKNNSMTGYANDHAISRLSPALPLSSAVVVAGSRPWPWRK